MRHSITQRIPTYIPLRLFDTDNNMMSKLGFERSVKYDTLEGTETVEIFIGVNMSMRELTRRDYHRRSRVYDWGYCIQMPRVFYW